MPAASHPVAADAVSGTVTRPPAGTTSLSPMLKQTTVSHSLPTLKLGSTAHESLRRSSLLDPADTLSPGRRRHVKAPRVAGADSSSAATVKAAAAEAKPQQQSADVPAGVPTSLRNEETRVTQVVLAQVTSGGESSSEEQDSSDDEESDEMAALARLVAFRGKPAGASTKTKQASSVTTRRQFRITHASSEDLAEAAACDATTVSVQSGEGWEPAVKARPPLSKKNANGVALAGGSTTAQPASHAVEIEEDDDWEGFYSGAKDASHRARGKHGNSVRGARCRQYAIDTRTSQRLAQTNSRR